MKQKYIEGTFSCNFLRQIQKIKIKKTKKSEMNLEGRVAFGLARSFGRLEIASYRIELGDQQHFLDLLTTRTRTT